MDKKFKFSTTSILGDVEESYLKFMGDNCSLDDKEFLAKFKELISSKNHVTIHAEIMVRALDRIIIQTVKFNKATNEYYDHILWVFVKLTPTSKYGWVLHRFRTKS